MSDRIPDKSNERMNADAKDMSRRRMLALFGITGAAAYVAPTLLSLDQARASGGSGGSGGGGGSGGSGGGGRGGRGSGGSGGRGSRGSRGSGRHARGRKSSVSARKIFRPIRRIFS